MIIMDSMTDEELDDVKPITPTRIIRIARGSGTQLREVQILIDEHKKMTTMVSKMGKMGLGK
jgi:signal recognition particle subunit SRP54